MLTALFVLALAQASPAASVRTTPDFSGTWKMDAARGSATGGGRGGGRGTGGGLGLGPSAEVLTIRQDTKTLVVEERRGTDTARMTYAFDGRAVSNTIPAGRSAGAKAIYVSRWDGDRLVTKITAPAGRGSSDTAEYQEIRSLDPDGSMLLETTLPGQPNARKVVYVKVKNGAGNGIRTRDFDLGKVALYH